LIFKQLGNIEAADFTWWNRPLAFRLAAGVGHTLVHVHTLPYGKRWGTAYAGARLCRVPIIPSALPTSRSAEPTK